MTQDALDALYKRHRAAPEPTTEPQYQRPQSALDQLYGGEEITDDKVGFWEAATTTTFGEGKAFWDWVPYIATGRQGVGWVQMMQAGEAFNSGTATDEQRDMLERMLDYHARERSFMGGVGEIAGELPTFALEFAGGLSIAKLLGKKLMKTAAGASLHKALTRMAKTKMAAVMEKNAVTRGVSALARAGAAGVAVGVVNELPRAPWGRVMANARRLQFQRRFGLDKDEAGDLLVEVLADRQSLMSVLPIAIVDELIEYGSEMTGGAIPFVSKLDALHDDILAFFFSKNGLAAGRAFLKKHGIGGIFEEIGEEYLGAAAREVIGQAAGVEELKGALPDTFAQTLEMYVAFGMRGGAGAVKGAIWGEGVDKALGRDVPLIGEDDLDAPEAGAPDISEEELTALEAMTPEEAEEFLRGKGLVPVGEGEEGKRATWLKTAQGVPPETELTFDGRAQTAEEWVRELSAEDAEFEPVEGAPIPTAEEEGPSAVETPEKVEPAPEDDVPLEPPKDPGALADWHDQYEDKPTGFHEWLERFWALAESTSAAEKPMDPSALPEEGEDWRGYSRRRGYTEDEIAEFGRWLEVAEEGEGWLSTDELQDISRSAVRPTEAQEPPTPTVIVSPPEDGDRDREAEGAPPASKVPRPGQVMNERGLGVAITISVDELTPDMTIEEREAIVASIEQDSFFVDGELYTTFEEVKAEVERQLPDLTDASPAPEKKRTTAEKLRRLEKEAEALRKKRDEPAPTQEREGPAGVVWDWLTSTSDELRTVANLTRAFTKSQLKEIQAQGVGGPVLSAQNKTQQAEAILGVFELRRARAEAEAAVPTIDLARDQINATARPVLDGILLTDQDKRVPEDLRGLIAAYLEASTSVSQASVTLAKDAQGLPPSEEEPYRDAITWLRLHKDRIAFEVIGGPTIPELEAQAALPAWEVRENPRARELADRLAPHFQQAWADFKARYRVKGEPGIDEWRVAPDDLLHFIDPNAIDKDDDAGMSGELPGNLAWLVGRTLELAGLPGSEELRQALAQVVAYERAYQHPDLMPGATGWEALELERMLGAVTGGLETGLEDPDLAEFARKLLQFEFLSANIDHNLRDYLRDLSSGRVEVPEDIGPLVETVTGETPPGLTPDDASDAELSYGDESAMGEETLIDLPKGRSLPAVYVLTEAEWLTPTHDAAQGFKKNPRGDRNERPYEDATEGKASRETVLGIARDMKPRQLLTDDPTPIGGPPVVTRWGIVLGGNARAMGIQLAYGQGKGDAYREQLKKVASRFGFAPEDVDAFENPVLVRELAAGHEGEPGELSSLLNEALTTPKTATTSAVSRGSKVTLEVAELVAEAMGEKTLAETLSGPNGSRLVGALIKAGALTDADMVALADSQGTLTKAGRDTVEQTLLGAAVPDVRALASLSPAVRGKLIRSLPGLVRIMRKWPIFSAHLIEAIDAVASLRESRLSLEQALEQTTFEEESWKANPIAVMLSIALSTEGPLNLAGRFRDMADMIEGKGGDLFAPKEALEPKAALKESFKPFFEKVPKSKPGGGFAMGDPEPTGAEMGAIRSRRAKPAQGVKVRPHGSGPVTQAPLEPPRKKRNKKTEAVVTTGVGALPEGDMRVERTHAVLRRFGILGRDDPIAIAQTMEEARLAAEGQGEVDLQGRDNLYEIIADLSRRFGLGLPGAGKARVLRKWSLGFYDSSTAGIRMRKASFLVTYFHELGHATHRIMFPRRGKRKDPNTGKFTVPGGPFHLSDKDFPVQWREDLVQLGRDLYGDKKPSAGYAAEGWAEVIRYLIADPAHLQARVPGLYQAVKSELLLNHPETWLVLSEARQRFRAWLIGSQDNPVNAFVQRGKPARPIGRTRRDRWTMDWFDRRVRVRTMLEDIGVMDKLPFHENPYWMMRRVENVTSGDLKKMTEVGRWDPADPRKDYIGKGLMEIFEPVKDALEMWEDYAIARRVLEKREQGFDVLPADPRADVTAEEHLTRFIERTEATHPEIAQAHAEFQEFNQWVIGEYAVHHELVTEEEAERIIEKNKEYITFRYATTGDALRKAGGQTGSFVNLGSGISWFKNSQGEPLLPVLPAYMAALEGIIGKAHHTAAARALLTLADDPDFSESTGRWLQRTEQPMKSVKITGGDLSKEVMRRLEITRGADGELQIPGELAGMSQEELEALAEKVGDFEDATFWKPTNDVDEARQVVRVMVEGRPQFYQITGDQLLWETLRGFYNPTQIHGILKVLTYPAIGLRAGATQNNISFGLANVVRDVWQALTLTTTMLAQPGQFTDRMRGIKAAFVGGKWADLYQASGADMEGLYGAAYWNEATRKLDLSASFDEAGLLRTQSRGALKEGKLIKAVWEGRIIANVRRGKVLKATAEASLLPLAGRLNSRLERMTRIGEFIVSYKAAEKQGLSSEAEIIAVAAHAAANITLDWTKGGRHAKVLNQFIPFFNAALLGPARIVEYLRDANKKGPGHLAAAFARISSFMIVPSVLMFLMVWDDEDYWNIDQRKRDRYWYFPTGRTDAGAKTYLRIPKPYGLATWSILAERSFASLFGIDPQTGDRTGDPESFEGVIGSILNELTPTFSIAGIQPVIEVMAGAQGYDFYWDNEIVPTRDKDLPVGMQGAERSSRFARMMGHALGYPPAKIDHLIYGFTAGAGRDMVRTVIDPMVAVIAPWTGDLGEPFRREDLPILRRFLDMEGRGRNEAVERFYEDWEDVDAAHRGLNRLEQIHGRDDERVEAYRVRHRYDLDRYTRMNRRKRRLSKLWSDLRVSYREVIDADDLEREILRLHREILEEARAPYQR